ncbi:MAG: hypothetical protein AB7V13_21000 [Pseudorhodoplanes sp.]|uniref:hypothetical protein n=1 Tax=Pseudorhodoplanes sp. TaxID=1934341 RepID=UPI003D1456B1
MASRDPFNIVESPVVASIPCIGCGNNMHCIRRQQVTAGEVQLFMCAACGNSSERVVGMQESDEDIQSAIEKSLGIARKAG